MKIAIVGSGISGLAAAWYLSATPAQITVLEKSAELGGHAISVDVDYVDGGKRVVVPVNPAYDLFNEVSYPRYVRLLRELGIHYEPREFSYTYTRVATAKGEQDWQLLLPTFLNRRNIKQLMQPEYLRFAAFAFSLARHVDAWVKAPKHRQTWGEFLAESGVPREYVEDFFLPVFARPWGVTPSAMRELPAEIVVGWTAAHRPLKPNPVPWMWNPGGARNYVDRFVRQLTARGVQFVRSAKLAAVHGDASGAQVHHEGGRVEHFDHVIVATNAQQARSLLHQPTAREQHVLGAFSYQKNQVVVHSDTRLLPAHRENWSYFNVRYDKAARETVNNIWFGQQQGVPVFATNFRVLPFEPDEKKVHARLEYQQPVFNLAAMAARKELPRIQGERRLWFCGVYACGTGHHEDGLRSAGEVVESLVQKTTAGEVLSVAA